MRSLSKLLLFAIVLSWWAGSAREAVAQATCWCEIDTVYSTGERNITQLDLTVPSIQDTMIAWSTHT